MEYLPMYHAAIIIKKKKQLFPHLKETVIFLTYIHKDVFLTIYFFI